MTIILQYKPKKSFSNQINKPFNHSFLSKNVFLNIAKGESRFLILWYFIISVLIHLFLFTSLHYVVTYNSDFLLSLNKNINKPIQVKIYQDKSKTRNVVDKYNKIIEAPQIKTEKPQESKYLGQVDHKTDKETKLDEKYRTYKKGSQAGLSYSQSDINKRLGGDDSNQNIKTKSNNMKLIPNIFGNLKSVSKEQWKNIYKNILPSGSMINKEGGYQDYIDDDLESSDKIDINTTEYRYIGYFSSLRQSIEMVWTYPVQAALAGISGQVELEFIIDAAGYVKRIKINKTSGYKILDDAIINAIKLASPFSPLPKDWGKKKLLIKGTFRYILTPY